MANRFVVLHVMQVAGREGLLAVLEAEKEDVSPESYELRSLTGEGSWTINGWAQTNPPPERGTVYARRMTVGLIGPLTLAPGMVLVDGE
jgi:hypothetical protein